MQVVEKFVINRDNQKYLYIETLASAFLNIQYRIYHDMNNFEIKSVTDFQATYGTDQFMSIYRAILSIDNDLVETNDFQSKKFIEKINELKEKFKNSSTWNPSVWGYRESLLSTIDTYNKIIDQREKVEEHDYEREYNRLEGNDIEDLLERIKK